MNSQAQKTIDKANLSVDERWAEVRKQLDEARASYNQAGEMSGDEIKSALKKRAKLLAARSKDEGKGAGEKLDVVEFLLAHEKYAIELSCIREVYPYKDCTPIPCTPSFVLGVINVRSRILSVVDLKEFFELPKQKITENSRVIILASDDMEFGVLADELKGVNSIPAEKIQPSLPTLTGLRAQYLKGVTAGGLVILDGLRILQDKRIVVNLEVE
ncbi:CheW protein [Desulfatibacillum alkenivorans DSM 16219]|jgi:purine-binding chemotaxis protein CheW|uniref:CheW protein n=1 Tax=Desulfatibacillum alkenivorans DSM 16219 TaxID=1121393 RepID=A0A1M6R0Z9_9BACT|nr:chemotaxis protein CheW [Desulfatibacillum alkenivorans]SHK26199.1 CheW protein [Desulfatibacillum alkenivorans DSM 16219]